MSDNKPDAVAGLGFKDKEKACETISILKGRDPDYQKLAIKGLIGRAKRVLTLTKDKDKLQNINEAIKTFDDWLKNYENSNMAKENRPYLPLTTMKLFRSLADKHNVESENSKKFFKAYEKVNGEYKHLRTVESTEKEITWDIVRNTHLKNIMKKYNDENLDLWDDNLPTKAHLEMIVWSYSPDANRIKKNLTKIEEILGKNVAESSSDSNNDDVSDNDAEKSKKRRSSSSSQSGSDESPRKKSKSSNKQ